MKKEVLKDYTTVIRDQYGVPVMCHVSVLAFVVVFGTKSPLSLQNFLVK